MLHGTGRVQNANRDFSVGSARAVSECDQRSHAARRDRKIEMYFIGG